MNASARANHGSGQTMGERLLLVAIAVGDRWRDQADELQLRAARPPFCQSFSRWWAPCAPGRWEWRARAGPGGWPGRRRPRDRRCCLRGCRQASVAPDLSRQEAGSRDRARRRLQRARRTPECPPDREYLGGQAGGMDPTCDLATSPIAPTPSPAMGNSVMMGQVVGAECTKTLRLMNRLNPYGHCRANQAALQERAAARRVGQGT